MKSVSGDDQPAMQSLISLLFQLSGKAWAALVVAVFCGGATTAFYFSSANAGSNSTLGTPSAAVQVGHAGDFGRAGGLEHCSGSIPAVPEANAGLVLIPAVAAMLLFSSRRLWLVKPFPAVGGQNAGDAPEPQ
jgi:hypothetical protein